MLGAKCSDDAFLLVVMVCVRVCGVQKKWQTLPRERSPDTETVTVLLPGIGLVTMLVLILTTFAK